MTTRPPQAGPPLIVPALVTLAFTIASLVLFASGPRPGTSATDALAYLVHHDERMRVVGFLVFGTSLPLAVWTATAYRRLRRLGVTAPGAAIALVGGTLACASTASSGLLIWAGAQSGAQVDGPVAKILVELSFAAGGPGFAAPLALLVAGVAVPALILRLAPRPLASVGLAIAAAGALSSFSLLTSALYPLLPTTRFGGLAWLVVVSLVLPTTRHESGRSRSDVAVAQ